jgi:hypothetical protein
VDEHTWLHGSDLERMLDSLQDGATDRKLRLLACACLREVWGLLKEERSRAGLVVNERYADGLATANELEHAAIAARKVDDPAAKGVWPARGVEDSRWRARRAAAAAAGAAERAAAWAALKESPEAVAPAMQAAGEAARRRHCALLRDAFGNPFRPVAAQPAWRTRDAVALATAIYQERAFDRLPILGDALEDAGCASADVLDHCRRPGPHARGCWVLDLLLGRS